MESIRTSPSNTHEPLQKPSLLAKTQKTDPSAPPFLQALADAMEIDRPTVKAEAASLERLSKPRSHMALTSLNPVQTSYTPESAALETIGKSRIVPAHS